MTTFEPQSETLATLTSMAQRKSGSIPPAILASHIVSVAPLGSDWGLLEEAMRALLRRVLASKQLLVSKRPPGRLRLGRYLTGAEGQRGARPYLTQLQGVDPPRGNCNCPDYQRSSLGLCKHLLAILDDLYSGPKKLTKARREQDASRKESAHAESKNTSRLWWDPVRPLEGDGDWLSRVQSSLPLPRELRRLFSGQAPKASVLESPRRRLDLVETLASLTARTDTEPALAALLSREHQLLSRRQADAPLARRVRLRPPGLKRTLYPYQLTGVRTAIASGRLLLADDMGLGKTTQAIAVCHLLHRAKRVKRGLLLVPASLKSQWLREWQETSDVPASVVEGPPDERARIYRSFDEGFLILNYEQLFRDVEQIRAIEPDLVVLDEAQRIKNWATRTAGLVKSLTPEYRLVLTGTPLENRLEELASIFDWVDDLALEPKWRLGPAHLLSKDESVGHAGGAQRLDTLRARLKPGLLRRIRSEVLDQLPPRTDTVVPTPLSEPQWEEHQDLAQPIARLMHAARRRPLTQREFLRLMTLLTRQRMICNGLALSSFEELWPSCEHTQPTERVLQGLFSPKLAEFRALFQQLVLDQGRTVVVFSQWRRMLKLCHWAISDLLDEHGLQAVFFTGKESQKQRTRNVVDLHDDPQVKIMFLSDAGGVGLNLQKAANACINLELPWNPAVLEQRVGRIYRLGQEQPVDIYNLICSTGLEAHIAQVVSNKAELFGGLFDGTSNELMFEEGGSMFGQLSELIGEEPQQVAEAEAEAEAESEPTSDDLDPPMSSLDEPETESAPDTVKERPGATAPARNEPSPPVAELLESLTIRRTETGGVVLEAPPQAAQALAGLFGKLSEMLAAGAGGES